MNNPQNRSNHTTFLIAAICVAGSIFSTGAVESAPEKENALPTGVPPVVGTAVFTPGKATDENFEWDIQLTVPKVEWEVKGKRDPKNEWPQLKAEVKEAVFDLTMGYHRAIQLAEDSQNRIVDLKGNRLSRKEAAKRLSTKVPVLVSVSGEMPDPFFLQCTKADTLIVILGLPDSPAPELLPASKKER